jgi:ribosomal protein S18 acetylase RimI-like enzyme
MNIRPIQPQDLPVCARIMTENSLWQRYGVTYESALKRLTIGVADGAAILVAGDAGEPGGFVWYVEKGAFSRSGYIMLIGVDPRRQGQRIGDALMDEAERIMFEKTKDVFLLVSDFNDGAQRFYRRRGYQQVGKLEGYVLPEVAELIFRKRMESVSA